MKYVMFKMKIFMDGGTGLFLVTTKFKRIISILDKRTEVIRICFGDS